MNLGKSLLPAQNYMKIDLNKFNELVDQKYLSVQKHPEADLLIFNYTQKCQFERFWIEETMMARGLITDLEGNIKARPFKKFFNLSEHTGEDSKLPVLPVEEFKVYEKLDGSLGILYHTEHGFFIATRGSFTSEQAIKANQILQQKYQKFYFHPMYTHLFEIIYKANKIVVDYGDLEDLVLLAVIDTESGEEIDLESFKEEFLVVKKYDGITDLSNLQLLAEDNREGFVVRFKSGVRVKVKFEEYVRLHRLVTGVNAKRIWEHLRDGLSLDELMDRVPDEFFRWVTQTISNLRFEYNLVEDLACKEWEKIKDLTTRKDQALVIKDSKFRGVIFKMLDKQSYDEVIWKMVKPVAEKPYKEDIDA